MSYFFKKKNIPLQYWLVEAVPIGKKGYAHVVQTLVGPVVQPPTTAQFAGREHVGVITVVPSAGKVTESPPINVTAAAAKILPET